MEVILELARPIGNAIAKHIFRNKAVEADSIISDALGMLVIVSIIILVVLAVV